VRLFTLDPRDDGVDGEFAEPEHSADGEERDE
jgi:hypothetical protein